MEQKAPLTFEWKLHTVMSDRGIRTSTELHRRLQPYGIKLTAHQITRVVGNLPARLNTELLAAILTELNCSPNDLFHMATTSASTTPTPADAAPLKTGDCSD